MSDTVKKILIGLGAGVILMPLFAYATPSSINRIVDHLEPLINTDFVKAVFFTAISTTNHSTFPNASTTALTATNASTTNLVVSSAGGAPGCGTFAANGTISNTGIPCVTSAGAAYPFTPSTNGGIQTSATSTAIDDTAGFFAESTSSFIGIKDSGWTLSTSTTICPSGSALHCQYYGGGGLIQAVADGWNTIYVKNGTYTITSPILIPRNGFSLIGESENSTIINYSRFVINIGIMNGTGAALTNTTFKNFTIKEINGGFSTCFDFSHLETSKIEQVRADTCKIGFIASTSASYYDTLDTVDANHIQGDIGGSSSVGIYVGDNGSGDGGPIETTIINPHIQYTGTGSSTGYYFNSHSIKCIGCDSELGYMGMHVGPLASDLNANVYLESNQINMTLDASQAQVGGYNITGNISTARSLAENIVDNGATGLCVNARVEFAAVNYCTNIKQGFGIINPTSILEVSNQIESATPGLSNNTLGLFGGRGTAISLDFLSGASWSGRAIVNPSVSGTSPILDFVLSTSSAAGGTIPDTLGVRFVQANSIGTGDVFVQPEASSSGYAVFEGRASTSASGPLGTMISSEASPVILAPNRTERLRVDYPSGNVGIGTTSPGTLLSIGNVSAINLSNGTSTWNTAGGIDVESGCIALKGICITGGGGGTFAYPWTYNLLNTFSTSTNSTSTSYWTQGVYFASSTIAASQFPYASTTHITSTDGAAFAINVGGVGIGTTTPESALDVKGGSNQGLFGSFGTSISIFNGANVHRITAETNTLDMVISTSTESGLRLTRATAVGGINNVFVQPEVQGNGYAIFEGFSTSTSVLGTMISSQGSPVILAPARAEAMRVVNTTGNVGIATTTPTWKLNSFSATAPQLMLSAGAGFSQWGFRNAGGSLFIGTTSVAGTATSTISSLWIDPNGAVYMPSTSASGANQTGYWCYDTNGQLIRDTTVCLVSALKFKKDIEPLTMGLDTVMKMKPVTYYLKQPLGINDSGQQIGFVADWSESIVPQLVTHDSNGDVHGFSYEQFTAVLTKAIQDLFAWNTKQDDRIQKLEDRVAALEAENAALK